MEERLLRMQLISEVPPRLETVHGDHIDESLPLDADEDGRIRELARAVVTVNEDRERLDLDSGSEGTLDGVQQLRRKAFGCDT